MAGVAQDRTEQLNLMDVRLLAYTRLLSPAMIRIGGTEADRVQYKPGEKTVEALYGHVMISGGQYEYTLTKRLWKQLHRFLQKTAKSPSAVFLDAVSWHYYPLQSSRGRVAVRRASETKLLFPQALNEVARWNRRIRTFIERINTVRPIIASTENWVTETGHALYGGEPGLSGSNYGLLDEKNLAPPGRIIMPAFYGNTLWVMWSTLLKRRPLKAPFCDGTYIVQRMVL